MSHWTMHAPDGLLELAEDPWTSEVIYLHEYFQIFYYFIP